MPRSRKTTKTKAADKDVISRLADAGEEALQRLGDLPGGKSLLKAMGDIRSRLDDTTTKLRKLDPLERRVSAIEKRLKALEGPTPPAAKPPTTRKTTARKTTSRAKPGTDTGAGNGTGTGTGSTPAPS